jgi:hypothetical protein
VNPLAPGPSRPRQRNVQMLAPALAGDSRYTKVRDGLNAAVATVGGDAPSPRGAERGLSRSATPNGSSRPSTSSTGRCWQPAHRPDLRRAPPSACGETIRARGSHPRVTTGRLRIPRRFGQRRARRSSVETRRTRACVRRGLGIGDCREAQGRNTQVLDGFSMRQAEALLSR